MKFWVVGCEQMHFAMWGDVNKLSNAEYVEGIFRFHNKQLVKICQKLVNISKKRYLSRFARSAVYHLFSLDGLAYDSDINFVILTDSRAAEYPLEYLQQLQSRYCIKFVLVYLNPFVTSSKETLEFSKIADYIFSYDIKDVAMYGFESFITVYSENAIKNKEINNIENDILYFGGSNGRLEKLWRCYEEIEKSGVKYEFQIVGGGIEGEKKYEGKIKYPDWTPYQEIIEKDRESNCLLEVLNDRQNGVTLRTMEAVLLNKKLLTNNKYIGSLPFYDERYMKVFDKPEDIDFEWVKKREKVEYNYNGECSPIRIIEKIMEKHRVEKQ